MKHRIRPAVPSPIQTSLTYLPGQVSRGTVRSRRLPAPVSLKKAVVGAGRHLWLDRLFLGSTGSYVLHSSPTSVLVVHEPPPPRERHRLLVASDGSRESDLAAALLGDFADPERCDVKVLSVAEAPIPYIPPASVRAYRELVQATAGRPELPRRTPPGACARPVPSPALMMASGPAAQRIPEEATGGDFD